jgi:hypothetical protein
MSWTVALPLLARLFFFSPHSKSSQKTFALKRGQCPPVFINNAITPESASVRYLGIQLDKKTQLERTYSHQKETY